MKNHISNVTTLEGNQNSSCDSGKITIKIFFMIIFEKLFFLVLLRRHSQEISVATKCVIKKNIFFYYINLIMNLSA